MKTPARKKVDPTEPKGFCRGNVLAIAVQKGDSRAGGIKKEKGGTRGELVLADAYYCRLIQLRRGVDGKKTACLMEGKPTVERST